MNLVNIVDVDTPFGYKPIRLYSGDIVDLDVGSVEHDQTGDCKKE